MYAGCDLDEYERGEFDISQYKRAGLHNVPNAVCECNLPECKTVECSFSEYKTAECDFAEWNIKLHNNDEWIMPQLVAQCHMILNSIEFF